MTIYIFALKGDLNGESRSGAFLFLSGVCTCITFRTAETMLIGSTDAQVYA